MSTLDEINNVFDPLVTFLDAQATYVLSGGTTPTTTAFDNATFPGLIDFVTLRDNGSSNFESGAAGEAIFTAAGISRELSMARLSKGQLYTLIVAGLQDDSDFYNSSGAFFSGIFSGNPTSGSRS